ncbi:cysteine hydrolase family protein [Paraglaciecola sp. 2405UD69-4]|uniref:cysteine hydrolase family protein n=1 Tax=Paraglaciecola sp. 2405UD69-4 TaxID=3391836 RepID=UPI0039C90A46
MADMAVIQLTQLQTPWIAPERTALCIIDVQLDFASPIGLLGQFGLNMEAVQPAIEHCQALVNAAHKAGVPVYFIGLKTAQNTDSAAWKQWMSRQGRDPEVESAICREDTNGCDFYKVRPSALDSVIYKTRYSAFHETEFDQQLQLKNIDTLVFCGVTTECCVESSVRDAFHRDYHAIVATDACAAYEPHIHEASLSAMAINFALLSNTKQICSIWEKTL